VDGNSIVLEQPGNPGSLRLKLLTGKIVVGRASTCDLVLNDVSVSRFHAEMLFDGREVRVRDLKSRNGTFVAGQMVEESTVALGERLQFGSVEFVLARSSTQSGELETGSVEEVADSLSESAARKLTDAQHRVFERLLMGKSEKEVAADLKVSRHTVHRHICDIYRLLEVNSRAELLALFVTRS
jgi:DNA-binding CsgD family transcriptional regulator